MSFTVIVPARLASSRLANKMLLPLNGKPLVVQSALSAQRSSAKQVFIACDHEAIEHAAISYDIPTIRTSTSHSSGTDRLFETCEHLGLQDQEIIVNVQGDEPLMPAEAIDYTAALLAQNGWADVATLCETFESFEDFTDPNNVKVVTATNASACYFSRAPIPHDRDNPDCTPSRARRHIGIYAYRVRALRSFVTHTPSALEKIEKLEQLRFLENGHKIVVSDTPCKVPTGIDTQEDYDALLKNFSS